MVPENHALVPNADAVVAEVIDGEAVLINLARGFYYSLDGVGGAIWPLIEEQRTLADVVAAVAAGYDVTPEQARDDVGRLVDDLVAEELVLVSDAAARTNGSPAAPAGDRLPYETPQLRAYRDMAELFAIDPPMPGLRDIPWTKPSGEQLG